MDLTDIHQAVEKLRQGEDFTVKVWTDKAVVTEYKNSLEIENDPEKKEKWLARQKTLADRQIRLDTLRFSGPGVPETDADDVGA